MTTTAESLARCTGSTRVSVVHEHRDPVTGDLVTDSVEIYDDRGIAHLVETLTNNVPPLGYRGAGLRPMTKEEATLFVTGADMPVDVEVVCESGHGYLVRSI